MKVKSEREVAQLCSTLRDPMDCSLLGSSVHGIFQARVLEWGAIAFSEATVYGVSKSWTRLSDFTFYPGERRCVLASIHKSKYLVIQTHSFAHLIACYIIKISKKCNFASRTWLKANLIFQCYFISLVRSIIIASRSRCYL